MYGIYGWIKSSRSERAPIRFWMPCMFACHAIELSGGGGDVDAAEGWDLVVV